MADVPKKPEEVPEMKGPMKQEPKMEFYESFGDMLMDLWMNSLNAKYASTTLWRYVKTFNRVEWLTIAVIYGFGIFLWARGTLTFMQIVIPAGIAPWIGTSVQLLLSGMLGEWKTLDKHETREHFLVQLPAAFLTGMFVACTEIFFLYDKPFESVLETCFQVVLLFSTNDLASYITHRFVHASSANYNNSGHEAHHLGGPRLVSTFTAGAGIIDNYILVPVPFSIVGYLYPPCKAAYYLFLFITTVNSYLTHSRVYVESPFWFWSCGYKYHHQLHHLNKNVNFGLVSRFYDWVFGTLEPWDSPKSKLTISQLDVFSYVNPKYTECTGLKFLKKKQ